MSKSKKKPNGLTQWENLCDDLNDAQDACQVKEASKLSDKELVIRAGAYINELQQRDAVEIFLGLHGRTCVQAEVNNACANGISLQINGCIFSPDNIANMTKE